MKRDHVVVAALGDELVAPGWRGDVGEQLPRRSSILSPSVLPWNQLDVQAQPDPSTRTTIPDREASRRQAEDGAICRAVLFEIVRKKKSP